MEIEGVIGYS